MAYHPYCEPKDPKPNPYGSTPEDKPAAAPKPKKAKKAAPAPVAVDTAGNTDAAEAEVGE
jgi:hypothetical protein